MSDTATMAAFGASEKACYLWPDDTLLDKARRSAFCEGAGWADAEIERLRRLAEHSADMLESAQSGFISGSRPDMEWDTHRDMMVKDLRAALNQQPGGGK